MKRTLNIKNNASWLLSSRRLHFDELISPFQKESKAEGFVFFEFFPSFHSLYNTFKVASRDSLYWFFEVCVRWMMSGHWRRWLYQKNNISKGAIDECAKYMYARFYSPEMLVFVWILNRGSDSSTISQVTMLRFGLRRQIDRHRSCSARIHAVLQM